jgi:ABC-2 type transport system permease protein
VNASEPATVPLAERQAPPLGGFNLTFLAIEVRRLLRNRRTVLVTVVVPVVLFLLFKARRAETVGGIEFSAASTMIGIAVYGAMLASTSGGAMVSIERAQGWSRQLRLTPLRPAAYIAIKILVAMLLGLTSVVVVYVVGSINGVEMTPATWLLTAILAWAASLVFASFGLCMGYLLPSENVMQFLGLVMAVLAFAGGLFYPLKQAAQILQDIAKWTPLYGLNQLVHAPLLGGNVDVMWAVNAVAWLLIFITGAVWRFRKDTARV